MAAGNDDVYKLDLEDIYPFTLTSLIPVFRPKPGQTTVLIGEITQDISMSSARPVFRLRDKIDCPFTVAFYTDNPKEDVAAMKCKVGHVICILNGIRHTSLDEQNGYGYRIEDPDKAFSFELSTRVSGINDDGEMQNCNACKKPADMRCAKCQVKYCSQECQAGDWKEGGHCKECGIIARLRVWNRTDWG
ncbi:hypothetical protein C8F01DRAFT_1099099 [Mycena amicta]|nr:hypothetical protein C8F01DRAFT_1099099 [Mycena amicta]